MFVSCEYVLGEVTTTTESNIVWLRHSLLTNCRVELTRAGLGYHFSRNLEMSGNSATVSEKAQSQGNDWEFCVVRDILLWQLNRITYLYFIRTVIDFHA